MARPRGLHVSRALAHRALLLPVGVVAAALIVLPLAAFGLGGAASARGAQQVLAEQPARAAALQVQQPASDDLADQDRRTRQQIAQHFPSDSVTITWSAVTSPVELTNGSSLRVATVPDLKSVAHLTAGAWDAAVDAGAIPATVQVDAAHRLGAHIGDTLDVPSGAGPARLQIVGLWRVDDPTAARWGGASDVGSGVDDGTAGPIAVSLANVSSFSDTLVATWTVTPTGSLDSDRLAALRAGVSAVQSAVDGTGTALSGADLQGSLDATLQQLASAIASASALLVIAVIIAAAVGFVIILVLLRLVTIARRDEEALLRTRGAAAVQVTLWPVAEATVVAAAGAAIGLMTNAAIAALTRRPDVLEPLHVVLVTAGVLIGTAGAAAIVAAPHAKHVDVPRGVRAGVSGMVGAGVVAAAAVFAAWRLGAAGTPVRTVGGRAVTDPVAAVAPVLMVLAAAAVVSSLGLVLAAPSSRAVARSRRFLLVLVFRRIARSWALTAPVVIIVVIAVATGSVAAGFRATTDRLDSAAASAVVGAAVRVHTDGDTQVGLDTPPPLDADGLPGVLAAIPVARDIAMVSGTPVPLIAMPIERAGAVLGDAGQSLHAAALNSVPRAGALLPSETPDLQVRVSVGTPTLDGAGRKDARGDVSVRLWVSNRDGVARLLPLSTDQVATGSTVTADVALPAGGPWRVLGAEASLTFSERPESLDSAGTAVRLLVPVTLELTDAADSGRVGTLHGTGMLEDLGGSVVIPIGAPAAAKRLPVVLSHSLAERIGVHRGDTVDFATTATSADVRAQVVGIVAVIPSAASREAVLADLAAFTDAAVRADGALHGSAGQVPRVAETWIASTAPHRTATAIGRALPVPGDIELASSTDTTTIVAPATAVLWTAAVLGVLGAFLILGATASVAARRDESSLLRALGVHPADAGWARSAELGLPILGAVIAGILGGAAAVATTAAAFASASTPSAGGITPAVPVVATSMSIIVPIGVLLGAALIVGVLARKTVSAVRAGERRVGRGTDGDETTRHDAAHRTEAGRA